MTVQINFLGDSWADVAKQMQAALGASPVFEGTGGMRGSTVEYAAADEIEGVKSRTRGPNKPKVEPEAPKEEAKEEAPKADAKDEAKSDIPPEGLDYERDIKPSVLEIAGRFGRDKVMEVLAKYGVTNAGHVPVEDQPALMADIAEVLAG